MATETAVINASSGVQTFYTTYAAARSAASAGDLIQIWADLNEQIILKNEVDIWIAPGRVLDVSTAVPTITDNNVSIACSIYGNGIIKNTYTENYPTGPYYECIKILHGGSKISIQCDSIDGAGGVTPDTIDGSSVKVTDATKFHLMLSTLVINRSNTAIEILNCGDLNLQTQKIESGDDGVR
jgi:hypothetical protein